MAQLLANELLIIIYKELLIETSFKYVNSISTVCKKWNELIKLVLAEEIERRFKNKIIRIEIVGSVHDVTPIYNSSDSTFIFHLNDKLLSYDSNNYLSSVKEQIFFDFKYENNNEYLVEFNLGTSLINYPFEEYEFKCNINWNYEDCMCVYTKDIKHNPESLVIKFENLILSFKKMCVVLDLLDGKLSTENSNDNQYKYINKRTNSFNSFV